MFNCLIQIHVYTYSRPLVVKKMSKAMASVSKNILKYERTVMIMASYNKVVIYETNE